MTAKRLLEMLRTEAAEEGERLDTSALEATLFQQALDRQREELAAVVEMHRCQCLHLRQGRPGSFSDIHESACPRAIAAKIREGGDQ